jgi:hypothetical protein
VFANLGGLALRLQPLDAREALPARDVERDHHPIAGLDVRDLGAGLLDDPHRLVAENVALLEERAHDLVEVEVRAADAGRGNSDNRVGGLLDRRVGHRVDAHIALAVPGHRSHSAPLWSGLAGVRRRRAFELPATAAVKRAPRGQGGVGTRGCG